MNFDKLITWATGVVLAAALAGHLDELQLWVWKAEAKLVHDSRTSTWGSPRFFGRDYRINSRAVSPTHPLNPSSKTTTDRKIHFEFRSN